MPMLARIDAGCIIELCPHNLPGPLPLTLDALPVITAGVRIDPNIPHWRDVTGCADVRPGSTVNALGEVAPPAAGWTRQFQRAEPVSRQHLREYRGFWQ